MANGARIVTLVIILYKIHCRTGEELEIRETYSYSTVKKQIPCCDLPIGATRQEFAMVSVSQKEVPRPTLTKIIGNLSPTTTGAEFCQPPQSLEEDPELQMRSIAVWLTPGLEACEALSRGSTSAWTPDSQKR